MLARQARSASRPFLGKGSRNSANFLQKKDHWVKERKQCDGQETSVYQLRRQTESDLAVHGKAKHAAQCEILAVAAPPQSEAIHSSPDERNEAKFESQSGVAVRDRWCSIHKLRCAKTYKYRKSDGDQA